MRRKLIMGSIATAAVAVGLVGSALPAVAVGSAAPAKAPSASPQTFYLAANGKAATSAAVKPVVAPVSRDSSLSLSGLTWTSWADNAAGTGVAQVNLCDPDCAHGTTAKIPAKVTLTAPQQVCGNVFYTRMQLDFTATPPAGLPTSTSVPIAPTC